MGASTVTRFVAGSTWTIVRSQTRLREPGRPIQPLIRIRPRKPAHVQGGDPFDRAGARDRPPDRPHETAPYQPPSKARLPAGTASPVIATGASVAGARRRYRGACGGSIRWRRSPHRRCPAAPLRKLLSRGARPRDNVRPAIESRRGIHLCSMASPKRNQSPVAVANRRPAAGPYGNHGGYRRQRDCLRRHIRRRKNQSRSAPGPR